MLPKDRIERWRSISTSDDHRAAFIMLQVESIEYCFWMATSKYLNA